MVASKARYHKPLNVNHIKSGFETMPHRFSTFSAFVVSRFYNDFHQSSNVLNLMGTMNHIVLIRIKY